VTGEGLLNKQTGVRGNLVVSFKIQFPKKLDKLQLELLTMALCLPSELLEPTHHQRQVHLVFTL
jgi:DnaJ-class molecular chaperone